MNKNTIFFLLLATVSASAGAKMLSKEQLPEKLLSNLYKKHPNATDLVAEEATHFGQALYRIDFKEDKQENVEFYHTDGHFYVNGEKIEAFNLITPAALDGLKAAFSDYKIIAGQLVINPNSVGEEYELNITAQGSNWKVSIDSKGLIINKEEQTATATYTPVENNPQTVTSPAAQQ